MKDSEAIRTKALVKADAAEGLWMQDAEVPATMMGGSSGKVVLDWTDV